MADRCLGQVLFDLASQLGVHLMASCIPGKIIGELFKKRANTRVSELTVLRPSIVLFCQCPVRFTLAYPPNAELVDASAKESGCKALRPEFLDDIANILGWPWFSLAHRRPC